MQKEKGNLTRLKNQINEKLPNDNDIFGYEGISKNNIVDSLEESHQLLSTLESFDGKLEVTLLKRYLTDKINKTNQYFKDILGTDAEKDKFNDFLTTIVNMKYRIKETHITLVDKPIRNEMQIQKTKEDLTKLQNDYAELTTTYAEVEKIKNESTKFYTDFKLKHTKALEDYQKIENSRSEIEDFEENIESINTNINTWSQDIQKHKEQISNNEKLIGQYTKKIESIKEDIDELDTKNNEQAKTLDENINKNKEHQKEIQKTIEDANRLGMAGAYKNRKDELRWSLGIWGTIFVLSLAGISYISFDLIKPLLNPSTTFSFEKFLMKLPIIAPLIWLGWLSAKQYGFSSRIREDYAFKYATSMAFEGYYNKTKEEQNQELAESLLQLTLYNMSNNPIRLYDKSNHASPLHELLDKYELNLPGLKSKKEKDKAT